MKGKGLWLPSVVGRMCLFLFFLLVVILLLYFLGNFQDFLDSTLIMLLNLFQVASIMYLVSSLYYGGLQIFFAIRQKRIAILSFLLNLGGFLFIAVSFIFVKFLYSWL